ncbi:hypothetical protein D3C80_394980 [compost metagenome]
MDNEAEVIELPLKMLVDVFWPVKVGNAALEKTMKKPHYLFGKIIISSEKEDLNELITIGSKRLDAFQYSLIELFHIVSVCLDAKCFQAFNNYIQEFGYRRRRRRIGCPEGFCGSSKGNRSRDSAVIHVR